MWGALTCRKNGGGGRGLLAEIEQHQPVYIELQEKRFRSGSNHMARGGGGGMERAPNGMPASAGPGRGGGGRMYVPALDLTSSLRGDLMGFTPLKCVYA